MNEGRKKENKLKKGKKNKSGKYVKKKNGGMGKGREKIKTERKMSERKKVKLIKGRIKRERE